MAKLITSCPASGHAIDTGIEIDEVSFGRLPSFIGRIFCSRCGAEHEWRKETAHLDLVRSEVRAPTDGYIVNLNLYPGDYSSAGVARMAMIDSNSFWVYGYFEETKIQGVHVGDHAVVRLLGGNVDLGGHVDSIASGIVDRDNPTGTGELLANVDPIFTWVRLAQRVPVRIHLDSVPKGIHLAMGMTCTITLGAGR